MRYLKRAKKFLKFVFFLISNSLSYHIHRKPIKTTDLLLVCHDDDRGQIVNGKPFAQIADNISIVAQSSGYSTATIAKPFSKLVGEDAYGNPISINAEILFSSMLSYLLFWLDREKTVEKLLTKIWTRKLKKLRPKIVIGIQPAEDLCQACKSLNIQIYDAQHGIISKDHPWYGDRIKNLEDKFLPTGFLVWDKQSALGLKEAEKKNLEIFIIGHPGFLIEDQKTIETSCEKDKSINTRNNIKILISLQWGLEDTLCLPEEKGLICSGLISTIKNSDQSITWHMRMHPVQIRQSYHKIHADLLDMFPEAPNIIIDEATNAPLPDVLSNMDLHITHNSTVVVEAGWMGIPSAILCREVRSGIYADYYSLERESGIAECIDPDEASISAWIDRTLKKEKQSKSIPANKIKEFLAEKIK